jgi:hypothetical protein
MKKKLKIEVYQVINGKNLLTHKIICGHLDATRNITTLSECDISKNFDESRNFYEREAFLTEKIDYFNIFEGMITIYYQSGAFMEISRL